MHSGIRTAAGAAAMVMFALAGCSHMSGMHMPWHRSPPPPPPQVHELDISGPDGTAVTYPQYWKRNTLLVDLQGVSGTGRIVLKPRDKTTWPVRIAFRVLPGQIGLLEVRADQRMLLPVTSQGSKPIDLELAPGVYRLKTAQMTVSWEPATPVAP